MLPKGDTLEKKRENLDQPGLASLIKTRDHPAQLRDMEFLLTDKLPRVGYWTSYKVLTDREKHQNLMTCMSFYKICIPVTGHLLFNYMVSNQNKTLEVIIYWGPINHRSCMQPCIILSGETSRLTKSVNIIQRRFRSPPQENPMSHNTYDYPKINTLSIQKQPLTASTVSYNQRVTVL